MGNTRKNNFDLLRLLAALQVLVFHARDHLEIQNEFLDYFVSDFLNFFPGIQIFFFISGFLIYNSFERNRNNVAQFFVNRFLRIYPALWVCFLFTVLLLLIDFNGNYQDLLSIPMLGWSLTQLSFLQFYTPDILRFWGLGTPNGSLWSISVEIQYYLIIPLLYLLLSKSKRFWIPFSIIFLMSAFTNFYIGQISLNNPNLISKFGWVFIVTHLHYFLIGIIIKKYWDRLKPYFEHKFLIWLTLYILTYTFCNSFLDISFASHWIISPLHLVGNIMLAGITFSFAYSFYGVSSKLLKGNDISYGLYIYHMLVINFLIHRNCLFEIKYLFLTILLTSILAILSWLFVEKPTLAFKNSFLPTLKSLFGISQIKIQD